MRPCVFVKSFFTIICNLLTLNSNAPTAIPEAAPVPESPIKCSLPILLAKSENPTYFTKKQGLLIRQYFSMGKILTGRNHICLPAKKNPLIVFLFGLHIAYYF